MEVYLVGGAVRDRLLGRKVGERDYVVIGATPEEMLAQGFLQVGSDFPVFLHPRTHEEYALARTERKTAPGYRGFAVQSDATVTLEKDLRRRDLTVNALAQDADGNIIDPYGGLRDLEQRVLRHVSDAFCEDPVRVLRVARFAARYADLGFRVAEETEALMRRMVRAGEVDALVPERVWKELERALGEPEPVHFFTTLDDCGALERLFPELANLRGVPQPVNWHPEVDTWRHTLLTLERATALSQAPEVRFAALTHDLGKGTTPREQWPRHRGHAERGVTLIEGLCERLRAPRRFRDLARLVARHHEQIHRIQELRPATLLDLLEGLDALRRPQRLQPFLLACQADAQGRQGFTERPYPQADLLRKIHSAVRATDLSAATADGSAPERIQQRVRQVRIAAIRSVLSVSRGQI
jgi:tRNA nucleotidyltransferase (CCA-adding enzyme)